MAGGGRGVQSLICISISVEISEREGKIFNF